MAANTVGAKGLLTGDPNNDQQSASLGTTNPFAGQNGVANPLAGLTPQLTGGASGVQQMNYGGALAAAAKQYQFNPKYAALDQGLQRNMANAGFDRQNALNALQQGYTQQTAEADRTNQQAIKNLTAKMLGQGIYNSGINLSEQGDLSSAYQRYVGNLGDQYAGGRASVENSYGRTLGDIASQREGLYQQQASEEAAAKQEQARQQAEATARQQQAEMLAQIQAQQIAAQQAALQNTQLGGYGSPYANGIGAGGAGGGGGGGGLGGFQGATDWSQVINLVNQSADPNQLQAYWAMASTGGAPEEVKSAINSRFVAVNDQIKSGANRSNPSAPHSGNSRAF